MPHSGMRIAVELSLHLLFYSYDGDDGCRAVFKMEIMQGLEKGELIADSLIDRDPNVTPLVALDPSKHLYLLELFCGPTFAFKDVALQFLGNLFEYFLVRRNKVRLK